MGGVYVLEQWRDGRLIDAVKQENLLIGEGLKYMWDLSLGSTAYTALAASIIFLGEPSSTYADGHYATPAIDMIYDTFAPVTGGYEEDNFEWYNANPAGVIRPTLGNITTTYYAMQRSGQTVANTTQYANAATWGNNAAWVQQNDGVEHTLAGVAVVISTVANLATAQTLGNHTAGVAYLLSYAKLGTPMLFLDDDRLKFSYSLTLA